MASFEASLTLDTESDISECLSKHIYGMEHLLKVYNNLRKQKKLESKPQWLEDTSEIFREVADKPLILQPQKPTVANASTSKHRPDSHVSGNTSHGPSPHYVSHPGRERKFSFNTTPSVGASESKSDDMALRDRHSLNSSSSTTINVVPESRSRKTSVCSPSSDQSLPSQRSSESSTVNKSTPPLIPRFTSHEKVVATPPDAVQPSKKQESKPVSNQPQKQKTNRSIDYTKSKDALVDTMSKVSVSDDPSKQSKNNASNLTQKKPNGSKVTRVNLEPVLKKPTTTSTTSVKPQASSKPTQASGLKNTSDSSVRLNGTHKLAMNESSSGQKNPSSSHPDQKHVLAKGFWDEVNNR